MTYSVIIHTLYVLQFLYLLPSSFAARRIRPYSVRALREMRRLRSVLFLITIIGARVCGSDMISQLLNWFLSGL